MTAGLLLIIVLNFVISCWNSYVVGMYWSEKNLLPTSALVTIWAGAIMAVCGFFSVYVVPVTWAMAQFHIFEFVAAMFKVVLEPTEVQFILEMVYQIAFLGIIFPILGSGLAITVNSWIHFTHKPSLGSGAVAGWNTYAQVRNISTAVQHVPSATKAVADGLGKIFKNKDSRKGAILLLLISIPLILSLGGAIFTFNVIMRAADRKFDMLEEVLAGKEKN